VGHVRRVGLISLGCAKNLVDSEVMLGHLAASGCAVTSDLADADVIVVNTCGFLGAARDEALEAIRQAVQYKETGRCRRVVVVGCLVQRDGNELRRAVPGIDALLGVNQRDQIIQAVTGGRGGKRGHSGFLRKKGPSAGGAGSSTRALTLRTNRRRKPECPLFLPADTARLRLTPRPYAYLRIGEGCDQRCTFCTIPTIRGPMRSKPPEIVIAEARELIGDGVVELNIIAQDTTAYGHDIGYAPGLAGLLRELNKLDGLAWIRLMYAYPRFFDDRVIGGLAECDRVVKYVDLPLQHINDRILRRMGRRVKRRDIETLLQKLRDRVPGIALRTTMMAGFPGETEAEFQELHDFIRDFRFDALGVFAYSHESGTPAARLSGHLPEGVKHQRRDALMLAQQAIAFAKADAMLSRRLTVLVEQRVPDGRLIARHAGQAPEVDSLVYVTKPPRNAGVFLQAEVIAREGYDLIARPAKGMLSACGSTCPTRSPSAGSC
jgi:ribosomal protein S12 methylthiotransferase